MFFKTCATLALATGFAAAKPISQPHAVSTPERRDITRRNVFGVQQNNAFVQQSQFSFIESFDNLNNQQQVLQIQENNLQIIDNGFQQAVVQQAQQVLVVNQQNNGFNQNLNNLFRKSNFQNNFRDQSTVMLVVNEIQVSVDDGFGNKFEQSVFAQSALVANRGLAATQTVMIIAETFVAQQVLGQDFNQGFNNNFQQFNNNVAFPTATAGVQLFGQKPTWSTIAADPAATLGAVWQKELDDLNNVDNKNKDNEVNNQAAEQEKKALEDAQKAEEEQRKQEEAAAATETTTAAAEATAAPVEGEKA